nr:MAG TPA: hypothetical protein [Caudoviricetes sp.]
MAGPGGSVTVWRKTSVRNYRLIQQGGWGKIVEEK